MECEKMKRLTPMDIYNKDFKHSIRGYDVEEVNEFLDLVIQSYEDVLQENEYLKQQIEQLKQQQETSNQGGIGKRDALVEDLLLRVERLEKIVLGK